MSLLLNADNAAPADNTKSHPILIVDDDPLNCEVLGRVLERSQYPVTVANSGPEALECLRQNRALDLVLLDIRMPGMNGIDTLKAIRKDYAASELPVIMVTAEGESATVVQALDCGANDYVTKPLDFSVLSARVRTQLAHKRAACGLKDRSERYALAARGSNEGLWDLNWGTRELYVDSIWLESLGYSREQLAPSLDSWSGLIHPEDREFFIRSLEQHCLHRSVRFEGEYRLQHRRGNWQWMLIRGMAAWDAAGTVTRVAGSQSHVPQVRAHDSLTGLPNRQFIRDRVTAVLAGSRVRPGDSCAVILIDLTRLRIVNESMGRRAGDAMLVEVARRLRRTVKTDGNCVARCGDGRFSMLLERAPDPAQLSRLVERLLCEIDAPLLISGHKVSPRASLGIAVSTPEVADAEDLICNADAALQAAKTAKGKGFAVFDPAMRVNAINRLSMEGEVVSALDRGEFQLVYQPQIDLVTERMVGVEALLRWAHPTRGTLSPNDFIPTAELTGAIIPIGTWVLREAAHQLVRFRTRFPSERDFSLAANVSPSQLAEPDFCDVLLDIVEESRVDPQFLKLELTESVFLTPEMDSRIEKIKSLGFPIEIDDFGTGYSSLSYMKRYRFDAVKIDRSFVGEVDTSREAAEILSTIIALARSLSMKVIAEGLETAGQVEMLRNLGCETGQGYYFSRPTSGDSIERMLSQQQARPYGGIRPCLSSSAG